jgi:hypothetical protein
MLGRIIIAGQVSEAPDGPIGQFAHSLAAVAGDNPGVLLRSFLIAIAFMAPVALWQGWRIRKRRHRERSASYQQASDLSSLSSRSPSDTPGPTLESLVAEINRVGSTLESSGTTELDVPAELTVGGSIADPQLVEVVLRDAIGRSGLEVTATESFGDSIRIRCHRR